MYGLRVIFSSRRARLKARFKAESSLLISPLLAFSSCLFLIKAFTSAVVMPCAVLPLKNGGEVFLDLKKLLKNLSWSEEA